MFDKNRFFHIKRASALMLILTGAVAAAAGDPPSPSLMEDVRLFSVPGIPAGSGRPVAEFDETPAGRYRFYPPLEIRDERYLRVADSGPGGSSLDLLFDSGTVRVILPALKQPAPVDIQLPPGALLKGAVLSRPGEDGSAGNLFLLPENDRPGRLLIRPEDPETLVYTPSADEKGMLLLTIRNRKTLRLTGLDQAAILLKAHTEEQLIPVYTLESDAREWTLSPLSGLDSLESEFLALPDFPEPLPAELDTILHRSSAPWRNGDFEVYSWARFPDILIWDCLDYDVQDRFFRRLAYFVEKKGFRGTLMTSEELEGRHGWNAHDYRPEDLANFYNRAEAVDFELYDEEWLMLEILLERGILKTGETGAYLPGTGAVLSVSQETVPVLRSRFLVHESSHGIYFTHAEYRDFCALLWNSLEEGDRAMWRFFLGWYGYDPADEDLMINEFQAYLMQQTAGEAPAYFGARMKDLAARYPEQQAVLSRGAGSGSDGFRLWAETLGRWTGEKWRLEPGDFFPLYKELP